MSFSRLSATSCRARWPTTCARTRSCPTRSREEELEDACQVAAPKGAQPFASVVVCTRDRPESLRRTLRSGRAGVPRLRTRRRGQRAGTSATREVVEEVADPRVRYVLEPRPGLSRARTAASPRRGARSSRSPTTTSSPTRPGPPRSTQDSARAARRPVTGLVPGRSSRRRLRRTSKLSSTGRTCSSPAATTSASTAPTTPRTRTALAFRRGRELRGNTIDARRGGAPSTRRSAPGRRAGRRGPRLLPARHPRRHAIAYEPAALVWHVHRREEPALVHRCTAMAPV